MPHHDFSHPRISLIGDCGQLIFPQEKRKQNMPFAYQYYSHRHSAGDIRPEQNTLDNVWFIGVPDSDRSEIYCGDPFWSSSQ